MVRDCRAKGKGRCSLYPGRSPLLLVSVHAKRVHSSAAQHEMPHIQRPVRSLCPQRLGCRQLWLGSSVAVQAAVGGKQQPWG